MNTTKSEQDKILDQILTEELEKHDSFKLSNVDNLSELLLRMMKKSYEAGANAYETPQSHKSALMRLVKCTLLKIRQLFCFHNYENLCKDDSFPDYNIKRGNVSIASSFKHRCRKCGKEKWIGTGFINY